MKLKKGTKLYYNGKDIRLNRIGFSIDNCYVFRNYFKDSFFGNGMCILNFSGEEFYLAKEMKKYFRKKV